MDYQKVSSQQCYGGIQRDTGMPFSIFGDVFLKGVFVVFEAAEGKTPRLGFAQQSQGSVPPQNLVPQDSSEPSPFDESPLAGAGEEELNPFAAPFGAEEQRA